MLKWPFLVAMVAILELGRAGLHVVFAGPVVKENNSVTVFLAGDSTVSGYPPGASPMAGWGQFIGQYFSREIVIKNHAIAGRSSKSFINEGRLEKIACELKIGDYLFIQFGHNDENKEKPERYADADTTYKDCLKKFVNVARQKSAIPVLITPMEQRRFDEQGHSMATHGKYPVAMIELGKAEHVPVIDLTTASRAYFDLIGPEKTKQLFMHLKPGASPNYPEGKTDDAHFQEKGANEIAKLVIKELQKLDVGLNRHVVPDGLDSKFEWH